MCLAFYCVYIRFFWFFNNSFVLKCCGFLLRVIFEVAEAFNFALFQDVNCRLFIRFLVSSISLKSGLILFCAMVLLQNQMMVSIIENEKDLSLSYQLSRNFWSWLLIVGSRSSTRPFGTILASRHVVKKLLCNSYCAFLSFSFFSVIAWYPECFLLWYKDDRRLEFTFPYFSTKVEVDGSLTIVFGVSLSSGTLLLFFWLLPVL